MIQHPTDVFMEVFEPSSLASFESTRLPGEYMSRRKYARIQLAHTGVLTPSSEPIDDASIREVSISLTLEPLHFGFLPGSVIPVVFAISMSIVLGIQLASRINRFLRPISSMAIEEAMVERKAI